MTTRMKGVFAFLLSLVAVVVLRAQTFPYPAIPQELRTPQERGLFLSTHYWDNFDFADTTLIHKPDITEQGFANFIDLLPRVDSAAVASGVEHFTSKAFDAELPPNVHTYFSELLEHYLYDPNSPMRSDELYAVFLGKMAVIPSFTIAERERFAYHLNNISKNRVGTIAANFAYVDRNGTASTLYDTQGDLIMLYFNDPDCDNCHAVTAMLGSDSLFADNPHLKVLAVYPDADTVLWRSHPQPFPLSWTDAYSPGGEIGGKQLYFIRATPTIYLLDKEKRVILKDASPQTLRVYLSAHTANLVDGSAQ